jgi:hypothetical protein
VVKCKALVMADGSRAELKALDATTLCQPTGLGPRTCERLAPGTKVLFTGATRAGRSTGWQLTTATQKDGSRHPNVTAHSSRRIQRIAKSARAACTQNRPRWHDGARSFVDVLGQTPISPAHRRGGPDATNGSMVTANIFISTTAICSQWKNNAKNRR